MKIAVVDSPRGWHFQQLQFAAEDLQCQWVSVDLNQAGARCGFDEPIAQFWFGDLNGKDFDLLFVRQVAAGSLEQIVVRMDLLGQLAERGIPVVNPARAIEASVDKYLALARLERAGMHVPRTVVCQSAEMAMTALSDLGGTAVLKPIFGSQGRGISRLDDRDFAWRAFSWLERHRCAIYLQQYIDHGGTDTRLLVVGQRVWGMQRSSSDWRCNAARGASCRSFEPTDELSELAINAVSVVGASIAGVDIVQDANGRIYVLEVNAAPGWKHLQSTVSESIATAVLGHLCEQAQHRLITSPDVSIV